MVAKAVYIITATIIEHDTNLSSKTFLDFTRKWIELNNRGGLIVVNDNMYIFIRLLEKIVKKTLTLQFLKQYSNEDVRDVLMKKFKENHYLCYTWDAIAKDIEKENVSLQIRNEIFASWIDIRANSFLKSYIQLVKRTARKHKQDNKTVASNKAEPALRKTLN